MCLKLKYDFEEFRFLKELSLYKVRLKSGLSNKPYRQRQF